MKPVIVKKYLIIGIGCLILQAYFQMINLSTFAPILTFGWMILFGRKFFNTSYYGMDNPFINRYANYVSYESYRII